MDTKTSTNPIQSAIEKCGGVAALAEQLGVTYQAVCFWRDGKRKMPVALCATIERVTDGAVTRRDLMPDDWWVIWPELVTDEYPVTDREAA